MSTEDPALSGAGARGATALLPRLRIVLTGAFWIVGSAIVVVAQPDYDRRLAAAGAVAAGLGTILIVRCLSKNRERRYFRSVIWTIVAVSLVSVWILQRLGAASASFSSAGLVERIALPLLFVLLGPLLVSVLPRELVAPRPLWAHRAALFQSARPMDRIMVAFATVVTVPALIVGLAHHDRLLFVAQDLGLTVFFVFMYAVGRAISAGAARALAEELIAILLALAVADHLLFHWEIPPLYVYVEAACAGALSFVLLRPRSARVLPTALAVVLLAADMVNTFTAVVYGSSSTTAVEWGSALAVLAYLALRRGHLVPQWLIVAIAVVGLAGFIGFTSDGATLRGSYHGSDQSNIGRRYEANQVRAAVRHSPIFLAFGRGLGSTIDERGASPVFTRGVVEGGRNLAQVQEIHLLVFSFLLKRGFLGLAWLTAFAIGLAVAFLHGLERSVRELDPSLVVYAALPALGFVQALAATSRLPANPLNALGLGILVTCLAAGRPRRVSDGAR